MLPILEIGGRVAVVDRYLVITIVFAIDAPLPIAQVYVDGNGLFAVDLEHFVKMARQSIEYGGVRVDSSTGVEAWDKDPVGNTKLIAETFREAGDIAADHGEFIVAEGEICWGGMHSWRTMRDLLEAVGRPGQVGYQADMAHSMLYTLGHNAEPDRILPENFDWSDTAALDAAYAQVADALRPWTLDFHVAQNDGTVFGSGDHEKTGRHCQIDDPNGRLDVPKHAGYWLRDDKGNLTRTMRHICWDGCMFPNAVMETQETWNKVLGAMVKVRDAHGWRE